MIKNLSKPKPYLQLLFILFISILSGSALAQSGLVRWNNTNFTPTLLESNITASNIISGGGVALGHQSWDVEFFETGSGSTWSSGGIDASKYIEFTISPNTGYQINLDKFNFYYRAGWTPQNFQVRYSKDNFATYYTSIGNTSVSTSWTSASANIASANPVLPGQTLKIRIYAYNTGATFHIRRLFNNGSPTNFTQTPTITGVVSPAVTGDPTDLKVTKTMNNDIPNTGDNVVYTILVENLGPNTASGASVYDQLPVGFSYVSSSASAGSYNNATGIWTIGDLANNASATLQITAQMQAAGPYTNTATVTHFGNDPVAGNNSDEATPTNVCGSCSHSISTGGGSIVVNSGEIYCLHSGTFTGTVTLNAGGTICIASGANFNPSWGPNSYQGTIINRGTMNLVTYNNMNHGVQIINYGTFNSTSLQNVAGSIENMSTGNINMPSGNAAFLSGAQITNRGNISLANSTFTNASVINYGNFAVNSGLTVNGGYWDNHLNGAMLINMTTTGSQMNFIGNFDNSGLWRFARISSLSGSVNNYGHMQIYNAVNDISEATYLTNDGLLEFIDVPEIQFNGPMLTNNGELILTHASTGNFKMNKSINQVYNNGSIEVSGQFEQNAAGSKFVNNCHLVCKDFFVGNGETQNNGLIHAALNIRNQGGASRIINGQTGQIRGTDFTNSGYISGYGSFYFTGTTNNVNEFGPNSFVGNSATNPILFYDENPSGPIFDASSGSINVVRPPSMNPADASSYNCTAPPSSAGYSPTGLPFEGQFCDPGTIISFDVDDYVTVATSPFLGDPFVLLYSSIRLFEHNNPSNPTNNSTNLVIPGKGTLVANATTGEITFTPDPAFTNGFLEAEYRISNKRSGDPITYPSARIPITIERYCACYKDPNTEESEVFTNTGISTQMTQVRDWPASIPNGFLALQSKDKGFVITRVANDAAIAEPVEGMLIYDIAASCVKLYNGTLWKCIQRNCD